MREAFNAVLMDLKDISKGFSITTLFDVEQLRSENLLIKAAST